MKRFTILFTVLALLSLSSNLFAQWQYDGDDIYYDNGNVATTLGNGWFSSIGLGSLTQVLPYEDNGILSHSFWFGGNSNNMKGGFIMPTNIGGVNTIKITSYFDVQDDGIINFSNTSTKANLIVEGKTGIGTTAPSEKLDVVGKIKSSGTNSALILVSPDGTEWEFTVDNSGNLTSQITKISEVKDLNEITVFPNPTDNILKIKFKESKGGNIELLDISGKLIYTDSFNTRSIMIDMNKYKSGVYILNIKDVNGVLIKSEKVIKK